MTVEMESNGSGRKNGRERERGRRDGWMKGGREEGGERGMEEMRVGMGVRDEESIFEISFTHF